MSLSLGSVVASTPQDGLLHSVWTTISFLVYSIYAISLRLLSLTTITIPKTVFEILHWSGFISVEINFQKLLILFILLTFISSWTYKLKVLNKYSALPKTPQLNKKFQNQIAFQDLNPNLLLNSQQFLDDHNHFNNYLDEFLSAIRVFGFLEKPVFHELARHLQTKRLLAGDTLSLDEDKSFYIVVDGTVQVFARTADSSSTRRDIHLSHNPSQSHRTSQHQPHQHHRHHHHHHHKDYSNLKHIFDHSLAYDNEDDNGFQLLNVVESGGTLSSLFTILSLFTEDVKLRYEDDDSLDGSDPITAHPPAWDKNILTQSPPSLSRCLNTDSLSHQSSTAIPHQAGSKTTSSKRGSVIYHDPSARPHSLSPTDDGQVGDRSNGDDDDDDDGNDPDDGRSGRTSRRSNHDRSRSRHLSSVPYTSTLEPMIDEYHSKHQHTHRNTSNKRIHHRQADRIIRTSHESHPLSEPSHTRVPSRQPFEKARYSTMMHYSGPQQRNPDLRTAAERAGAQPRESTIARATTDTTLAVIPSEAFKRLTSKFPNAVAHIVQVILTRLQRVTFLTSHQYLGLTKELLRTEKAFNELACYPLPAKFYEEGGMIWLRQRFMPNTKIVDEPFSYTQDYFNLDPVRLNQPLFNPDRSNGTKTGAYSKASTNEKKPERLPSRSRGVEGTIPPPLRRGSHSKLPISCDLSVPFQMQSLSINHLHEDLELRRLVMKSIAKSIGLVQQPPSRIDGSNHGSHLQSPSVTPFSSASRDPPSVSPEPSGYDAKGVMGSRTDRLHPRPGFRSGLGSLSYLKTLASGSSEQREAMNENSSNMSSSSVINDEENDEQPSEELRNEVEILFFPKDSVLVKAGERNAGLYFVIDGFLDVFMPSEDRNDSSSNHRSEEKKKPKDEEPPKPHKKPMTSFKTNMTGLGQPNLKRSSKLGTFDDITDYSTRANQRSRKVSRTNRNNSKSTGTHRINDSEFKLGGDQVKNKGPIKLFSIKPGGIAGYLASISSFPSYVDIRAKTDVYVGFLPARALESIMDRKPIVLLTLAKRLISLLSPLMLHIDSALEWMAVDAGQIIYREGDHSESIYIVIGGRLRLICEKSNGDLDILGEFGQGESIGELDCITNARRKSTLHAIRDSELVRIPMTLFNAISIRHPAITIQVSRLIASRVREELDSSKSISLKTRSNNGANYRAANKSPSTGSGHSSHRGSQLRDLGMNNFNLKTVAIIPNTRQVPAVEFASRLKIALEQMNSTTEFLDQGVILSVLGRHAFSRLGKLKLAGWLTELEQKARIVLYVADTGVNAPWTQTCIRQADYIMLVCDGGSQPDIGEYERLLISMKTTARKELVLLHPDRNVPAGSTRPWLNNRPWIHAHHHVEMAGSTPLDTAHSDELLPLTAFRNLKQRVQTQISKYRGGMRSKNQYQPSKVMLNDDFSRLARRLCGKSIGVVLGGGGARGISHIGVLRALNDYNIPIDMIGGTSIGSFIGGLYARNSDFLSTLGRAKTFSSRMATLWRILTDITYPVVAYTTGHEFNRGIYKSFYDYHIEDFWLPFWANTTNITWSRMEVHTTGYAWRYIRASMSLAGLLPPLCDDGDMLVDGGYIDNLPVSVMLRMGADSIFAVDVGSIDDTSPRNFPESVSGWWLLINRWNPWSSAQQVPTMTDVQSRLTYVSSVKTLEEAKATPGVLYMRMPVTEFTTMGFGKFEEILKKGYEASTEMFKEWALEGKLPTGLEKSNDDLTNLNSRKNYDDERTSGNRQRITIRRNSV